jgi:hypothetical protein
MAHLCRRKLPLSLNFFTSEPNTTHPPTHAADRSIDRSTDLSRIHSAVKSLAPGFDPTRAAASEAHASLLLHCARKPEECERNLRDQKLWTGDLHRVSLFGALCMYEFALCLRSADTIKCERCIGASGHEAARVIRQVAYDEEEADEAEETTLAPPSLSLSLRCERSTFRTPFLLCEPG